MKSLPKKNFFWAHVKITLLVDLICSILLLLQQIKSQGPGIMPVPIDSMVSTSFFYFWISLIFSAPIPFVAYFAYKWIQNRHPLRFFSPFLFLISASIVPALGYAHNQINYDDNYVNWGLFFIVIMGLFNLAALIANELLLAYFWIRKKSLFIK